MLYAFGDARISPYVTSASRVEADTITENVGGTVGLYDTAVRHSIQLEYNQTDFDKMMKEFKKDGTKDSIPADLTIDGIYLRDVGIRLKGNSTLRSLQGAGGMPGGGGGGMPGEGGGQNGFPGAGEAAWGRAATRRRPDGRMALRRPVEVRPPEVVKLPGVRPPAAGGPVVGGPVVAG